MLPQSGQVPVAAGSVLPEDAFPERKLKRKVSETIAGALEGSGAGGDKTAGSGQQKVQLSEKQKRPVAFKGIHGDLLALRKAGADACDAIVADFKNRQ